MPRPGGDRPSAAHGAARVHIHALGHAPEYHMLAETSLERPVTAPTPCFQTITPVLRIFDVPKAKEFYVDYLGFNWDWEQQLFETAPLYAQVSRSGLTLHLSEHYGDGSPGTSFLVDMTGVEAFRRELEGKAYGGWSLGQVAAESEGLTVQVVDPFGNRIRFQERKPRA